jgi:hypothetical protein
MSAAAALVAEVQTRARKTLWAATPPTSARPCDRDKASHDGAITP